MQNNYQLSIINYQLSINGQLGSGKSAVCDFLKEKYGFLIFSTGQMHRQLAKERGLTAIQFNEFLKTDSEIDDFIDKSCIRFHEENRGENIIFDSRLAWHFIADTFKIFLMVSPAIAANRVFKTRIVEEKYQTKDDALAELITRRELENERFVKLYGVDCNDYQNYDLLLDTSCLNIEQVAETIMAAYRAKAAGKEYDRVLCFPQNLYPTVKISALDMARVQYYMEKIRNGEELAPVSLIRYRNELFIHDGHHRVLAGCRMKLPAMRCTIDSQEHDMPLTLTLSDIHAWEEAGGFTFGFYPEIFNGSR